MDQVKCLTFLLFFVTTVLYWTCNMKPEWYQRSRCRRCLWRFLTFTRIR